MTPKTLDEKIAARKASLNEARMEKKQLEALAFLLDTCEPSDAPTRIDIIARDCQMMTVGIGKDNTANVYLWSDDIEALNRLLGRTGESK